jgi:hypothetical protein
MNCRRAEFFEFLEHAEAHTPHGRAEQPVCVRCVLGAIPRTKGRWCKRHKNKPASYTIVEHLHEPPRPIFVTIMRCSPRVLVLFIAAAIGSTGAQQQVRHGLMCRDDACGSGSVTSVEEKIAGGSHERLCCFQIDGVQHETVDPAIMGATWTSPAGYPVDMRRWVYSETGRCFTNHCGCEAGYDGPTCQDIDECALNNDNCDPNASCINTAGGFACICGDGYTGDGTVCQPDLSVSLSIDAPVPTLASDTSSSTAAQEATIPALSTKEEAQPLDTASSLPAPSGGFSTGGVVLACAVSTGVTVMGLWAWSRHVASRQVRTRLDTRLADFEHDPEHLSGGGANPRGTVWATINRLTKTLSSASASSPMAAGERLDGRSCDMSPALSSTSSNVDTV